AAPCAAAALATIGGTEAAATCPLAEATETGSTTDTGALAADQPPPVAIGEDMANRVQPYADRIGAETYQPDLTAPRSEWEQNQRDWINKMMDDGRVLHDCGPSPSNPNFPGISSPWYGIEHGEIGARNYPTTPVDC